jgi:hypothetical protein
MAFEKSLDSRQFNFALFNFRQHQDLFRGYIMMFDDSNQDHDRLWIGKGNYGRSAGRRVPLPHLLFVYRSVIGKVDIDTVTFFSTDSGTIPEMMQKGLWRKAKEFSKLPTAKPGRCRAD